ncbi:MAG: cell division protein SepF [Clostridia bacterium]|nr:cell division protein SepF [Clostridia bacterium]
MGLFKWLMNGIGFENEEQELENSQIEDQKLSLAQEKKRAKELKKQERLNKKLEKQRRKNNKKELSFETYRDENFQESFSGGLEERPEISETTFSSSQMPTQSSEYEYNPSYGQAQQSFGGYDGNMYSQTSMSNYGNKNIIFFYPKSYSEVQKLIDYLKNGESVMLNLDGISDAEAQRMLDFSSGAVYAVNGSIKRVAGNIFLLTPEGLGIVSPNQ